MLLSLVSGKAEEEERVGVAALAVAASPPAERQEQEGALMWGRGALLIISPPGLVGPAEELEVALPVAA